MFLFWISQRHHHWIYCSNAAPWRPKLTSAKSASKASSNNCANWFYNRFHWRAWLHVTKRLKNVVWCHRKIQQSNCLLSLWIRIRRHKLIAAYPTISMLQISSLIYSIWLILSYYSRSEYFFSFNDKFEIHDDIEILKRMGLLLGTLSIRFNALIECDTCQCSDNNYCNSTFHRLR